MGLTRNTIDYEPSNNFHVYAIRDDGIGVREQDAKKIFDMFQRNETCQGIEGSGLGLVIAQQIVERHAGLVWLEPCDQGVCFRFSISGRI